MLVFVGIKMLMVDVYKIPIELSLLFIGTIITASILISWKVKNPKLQSR